MIISPTKLKLIIFSDLSVNALELPEESEARKQQ